MPLPAPNLDDRSFQDILDEARRMIPRYCPEWTDHNLSDPGITLLELFAWMTDLMLYRINRVPDKNHIKFLELLGTRLEPARAATAELSFRLAAPQPEDVVLPAGTSVATTRTETREAISFSTDREVIIRVPQLTEVLASRGGSRFHDYHPALANPGPGLGIFQDKPQPDDGLYLGFGNDLGGHILGLTFRCRIEGIGVDPADPPLAWETWDGLDGRWVRVVVEHDETGGLNRDGVVILHLPATAASVQVDNRHAFWVRGRVLEPRAGQPGYSDTPRLLGVEVESLGAIGPASHVVTLAGEVLGISDGTPGQAFQLQSLPVLARREGETLEVEGADGTFEAWVEVADFSASGADAPHFVLDAKSGAIEFGPSIRSPQQEHQQYGRVPPAGRHIRFSSYRSGGGLSGNVGARTLSVVQSSIPYIATVTNLAPAVGGTDSEDIEHAKWRAPQVLRARERAVTAEDFETLARAASPAIARARCLPVSAGDGTLPGTVRLQLVPALPATDGHVLTLSDLEVPARIRQNVQQYLDDRRLLGSELLLESPAYTWISVLARVRPRPRVSRARVIAAATDALYRFVHPTTGGPDSRGWPFGRELFAGEIYSLLQVIDGVDIVEEVTLHQVDPLTRGFSLPVVRLAPADNGLLCSFEHRVRTE
jgi:predicted phage baseplate assembly protein